MGPVAGLTYQLVVPLVLPLPPHLLFKVENSPQLGLQIQIWNLLRDPDQEFSKLDPNTSKQVKIIEKTKFIMKTN
jgi:hypothetical protein